MRKLIIKVMLFSAAVILLMLPVCSPALADSPLVPGPEDLPMDQAVHIASGTFMTVCSITEKELGRYTVQAELWLAEDAAQDKRAWTVVFHYAGRDDLNFSVRAASPSGKVLEYGPETFAQDLKEYLRKEAGRKTILDNTALWEKERGHEYFWPYEDKALFFETYGHAAGYTAMKPGLPDSGDLNMRQAVDLAREAVLKEFGVAKEQLDALKPDCTFLPDTFRQKDGTALRIWMIAFRYAEPDSSGLNRIKYQVNIVSPQGEINLICDHETGAEQDERVMKEGAFQPDASEPEGTGTVYYNPMGGVYFHADQNCKKVSGKYLPLTALSAGQLQEASYAYLLPCPVCVGR